MRKITKNSKCETGEGCDKKPTEIVVDNFVGKVRIYRRPYCCEEHAEEYETYVNDTALKVCPNCNCRLGFI
jgi:hypothetical protein